MMNELDEKFWSSRYQNETTGWDIGAVSTPIKEYVDQLEDKNQRILIPGAGNAYEAQYLWESGFKQITVVDIAKEPLANLKSRIPDFPDEQLVQQNFFELEGEYDLIIEQTFFCALIPSLRQQYVEKMHELLAPKGKLVGVLFNIPLNDDKPPFGGDMAEYELLFKPNFDVEIMEEAYNSIPPRMGSEVFIKLRPKSEL